MSDVIYIDGYAEFQKFNINTSVYTFFDKCESWYFRTFSELDYDTGIAVFRIFFTPYHPKYVMNLFDLYNTEDMRITYDIKQVRKPYKDAYYASDKIQFFADSIKAPVLDFNIVDGYITLSIFEDYNGGLMAFTVGGEFDAGAISIDQFTDYVFKSVNGRRIRYDQIEQMRSL